MTAMLACNKEPEEEAGSEVSRDIEKMIAEFCAEHGAETYEATIEGVSGFAKGGRPAPSSRSL